MIGKLTPRESELMPLLAEGLTYGEMAERQCVSLWTIRNQVHSIYTKLEVAGMANARVRAARIYREMELTTDGGGVPPEHG